MGDIDFRVISTTENSNKFQNTKFWKEKKSVEDMVTLEGLSFNSSMISYLRKHEMKKNDFFNF